jgi:hypothetical protein
MGNGEGPCALQDSLVQVKNFKSYPRGQLLQRCARWSQFGVISTQTGVDFHLDFHAQKLTTLPCSITHCGYFLLVKNSETANLHGACMQPLNPLRQCNYPTIICNTEMTWNTCTSEDKEGTNSKPRWYVL